MVKGGSLSSGGNEPPGTKDRSDGGEVSRVRPPAADGGAGGSKDDDKWAVAFMFLTTGEEKNAEVWASWLKGAKPEEFNFYVHAKEPEKVHHPLLKKGLINTVKTKWGTISLVEAHITLIRAACKNPRNKWFILLSDSCLPVRSFGHVRGELSERTMSIFDMHPKQVANEQRKNIESYVEDIVTGQELDETEDLIKKLVVEDKLGIQVHSQWCCLTRKDASLLATATDLDKWFGAYKMMCSLDLVRRSYLLAPDELFIHSYLRYHARKKGDEFKFATQQTTFAHCCLDMDSCTCSLARSSHPITLASMHPVVVLRSMQRHSFFARKFSPNQVPEHWEAVWRHESDPPRAMEAAQLAFSLASPDRLTDRQKMRVAYQLSAVPKPESVEQTHSKKKENPQSETGDGGISTPSSEAVEEIKQDNRNDGREDRKDEAKAKPKPKTTKAVAGKKEEKEEEDQEEKQMSREERKVQAWIKRFEEEAKRSEAAESGRGGEARSHRVAGEGQGLEAKARGEEEDKRKQVEKGKQEYGGGRGKKGPVGAAIAGGEQGQQGQMSREEKKMVAYLKRIEDDEKKRSEREEGGGKTKKAGGSSGTDKKAGKDSDEDAGGYGKKGKAVPKSESPEESSEDGDDSGNESSDSGDSDWSAQEVGEVVEILCNDHAEDDTEQERTGKVAALIVKHIRNYVFVVRFQDQKDIRVDFDKTSVWRADPGIASLTRRRLFGYDNSGSVWPGNEVTALPGGGKAGKTGKEGRKQQDDSDDEDQPFGELMKKKTDEEQDRKESGGASSQRRKGKKAEDAKADGVSKKKRKRWEEEEDQGPQLSREEKKLQAMMKRFQELEEKKKDKAAAGRGSEASKLQEGDDGHESMDK